MEWKEFYTTKRKTWDSFLQGIQYGLIKILGSYDWLTLVPKSWSNETLLDTLKRNGKIDYACDGVVIDVEYGVHIYIAARQ